jgi:3-methyladenine DNA glycosylase AlkD
MQAYMRSTLPYRGVPLPTLRTLVKPIFESNQMTSFEDWQDTVLGLWRSAEYREERYAAIALTGHRFYRKHQHPGAIPVYDELVATGAWWDYVDEVAAHRLGPMLNAYPDALAQTLREWCTDSNLWRRRGAIISQVLAKSDTDVALLYACIEPNLEDREFFIRKAIGWALRAYAWTDPAEVVRFVEAHPKMSGLSRREALRNVPGQQPARAGTTPHP